MRRLTFCWCNAGLSDPHALQRSQANRSQEAGLVRQVHQLACWLCVGVGVGGWKGGSISTQDMHVMSYTSLMLGVMCLEFLRPHSMGSPEKDQTVI